MAFLESESDENCTHAACFVALVWILGCPLAFGGEKEPQAVKVAWETDYRHAMDVANQQQKMLLIFFYNPNDPQSQRLESETLANAGGAAETARVRLPPLAAGCQGHAGGQGRSFCCSMRR